MSKTALITGITGQDGAYLAKFLLDRDYKVFGTFRRLSTPNFWRLQYLDIFDKVNLIPADLVDGASLVGAVKLSQPDEIYHLAAQSFVGASFEQPVGAGEITGLGVTTALYSRANVYDADDECGCRNGINGTQEIQAAGKDWSPIKSTSYYYTKSWIGLMPCPNWLYPGSSYSISPANSLLSYDKRAGLRSFYLD